MIAETHLKGFNRPSNAQQIPGHTKWELITVEVGYYIQSPRLKKEIEKLMAYFQAVAHIDPRFVCYGDYDHRSGMLFNYVNFICDYASIPRILWAFLAPRDLRRPAIHHDLLYRMLWILLGFGYIEREYFDHYRKVADDLFREASDYTDPLMPVWKRNAAYRQVRWWGGRGWVSRSIEVPTMDKAFPDPRYISRPAPKRRRGSLSK